MGENRTGRTTTWKHEREFCVEGAYPPVVPRPSKIQNCNLSQGEKILSSGTDPGSYITENSSIYEDFFKKQSVEGFEDVAKDECAGGADVAHRCPEA